MKRTVFIVACISLLSFGLRAATLTITTIHNNTERELVIIDRFSRQHVTLPAMSTTETSLTPAHKNIVMRGDMVSRMAQQAQYLIKKASDYNVTTEQEVYLNICLVPGGINDGSGIICGSPGTVIFKLIAVGMQGGHSMQSATLQGNLSTINCSLTIEQSRWVNNLDDVLLLNIDYALETAE